MPEGQRARAGHPGPYSRLRRVLSDSLKQVNQDQDFVPRSTLTHYITLNKMLHTIPSPHGNVRIYPFPCACPYGSIGPHKVLSGYGLKGARQEQSLLQCVPGLLYTMLRVWVDVREFFPALHEFFCIAKLKQVREGEKHSHLIGCD